MAQQATHMLREELFDLSDLLARLATIQEECLDNADAIKVTFGRITVNDENDQRLGYIKCDGGTWIFVPTVSP